MKMALDQSRDIMLAYMQSGERLLPDHGFPVKMIIVGKCLKRIVVTTQESGNYYHFNDNRVMQSHVDAELANTEGDAGKLFVIIANTMLSIGIRVPSRGEDEIWLDSSGCLRAPTNVFVNEFRSQRPAIPYKSIPTLDCPAQDFVICLREMEGDTKQSAKGQGMNMDCNNRFQVHSMFNSHLFPKAWIIYGITQQQVQHMNARHGLELELAHF